MAKSLIFKTSLIAGLLVIVLYFSPSCTMINLRNQNPEAIGAIAESSGYLAEIIISQIPQGGPEKRILEVGAGTGVFTKKLIEKLGPNDHLDVVELMPQLCSLLDEKFGKNPSVSIYCGDILNWKPAYNYSYIVSGIPFNSFTAKVVKEITDHYIEIAEPNALCSFFEYKWLPSLRVFVMNQDDKTKFQATRAAIENFIARYEKSSAAVYLNLPPATVHFLEIKK